MLDKIRICPHCNNEMRPWKSGDHLPDFAEVDWDGKPIKKWWVCPGTPSAFTMTFNDDVEAPNFLGRWRDKKGVWHNVLNVDVGVVLDEFSAAFFRTEEEAREKVHKWADAHLDTVDLVSIERAHQ